MLRCRDVVDLVGGESWRDAPLLRRAALVVHLAMCRHCRGYTRALRRIGTMARRLYAARQEDLRRVEQLLGAVRRAAGQGP